MRMSSYLPVLALCIASLAPLTAQVPPEGGVTSEDLLDKPPDQQPPATPPLADPAPDPVGIREAAAEQAFAEGDLARAIAIYRDLGATHPVPAERSRLRVTAAWLLFQQGDAAAAGTELSAALFEDPGYQPRAEIYSPEFLALFQNAQRDATLARQRAAAAKLKQGNDAFAAGDTVAARGLITASLELAPGAPRALFSLAQVDFKEQRIDAALAGFEKVLSLARGAPESLPRELEAQALNNVGVIYIGRQQYEDAASSLSEASHLAAGDSRVWFNLGLALLRLERTSAGLDAIERAHTLDRRDAEIASELGRALTGAGRYVEAVSVLLEGTQAHPDSATLWLEFAAAQQGLGNETGRLTSLRRALELDPANAQGAGFRAAVGLAQAALAAKDFGEAATAAEAATRIEPRDGTAWAVLGLAQQASGKLPEAALSLEKAAAVAPDRADIAHNLGTVYLAQRRYPEAETALRRAVALDPASTESAAALSRLEAQRAGAPTGQESGKRPPPAKSATSARPKRPELGATLKAVDYPPLGIRGLLVEAVGAGGLADRAGLLVDDLILRASGRPVTQASGLQAMIESSRGISIQLSVLRAGKPVEVILHP